MAFLSTAFVLLLSSTSSRRFRRVSAYSSRSLSSSSYAASTTIPYQESRLISSSKSNTVKTYQSLLHKRKKRDELGATVVEGPKMIFDLLRNPQTRGLVQQIIIASEHWNDYASRLEDIFQHTSETETTASLELPEILPATSQVVAACSDVVTCQGIVARVSIPKPTNSIISNTAATSSGKTQTQEQTRHPIIVIADGLQDPGNLGTLIRSCAAAGVTQLVALPNTCDPWSPKSVRSAMGMSFALPIKTTNGNMNAVAWRECCDWLFQEFHCQRVLAATMVENDDEGHTSKCYFDIDYTSEPTAIVLGSEGSGLSNEIYQHLLDSKKKKESMVDGSQASTRIQVQAIHIPMMASVESLNAAVSGSIILYEYVRQRNMKDRLGE